MFIYSNIYWKENNYIQLAKVEWENNIDKEGENCYGAIGYELHKININIDILLKINLKKNNNYIIHIFNWTLSTEIKRFKTLSCFSFYFITHTQTMMKV